MCFSHFGNGVPNGAISIMQRGYSNDYHKVTALTNGQNRNGVFAHTVWQILVTWFCGRNYQLTIFCLFIFLKSALLLEKFPPQQIDKMHFLFFIRKQI